MTHFLPGIHEWHHFGTLFFNSFIDHYTCYIQQIKQPERNEIYVWRLWQLTRKFNDPKVQDFKSCRGEAFRDYFMGRKTQKVKNHGEPKLTVNGDLFQRTTTNSK